MKSIKGMAHVDALDYVELPTHGGRARDTRSAEMPGECIPFDATHTVSFVFREVTFKTNVKAKNRGDAERRAVKNLHYTFWPEHRLRDLGPILKVVIHDA